MISEQRQQRDRGQVERDGDGLVIAAVQPVRGEVQAGERQAEHQERLDEAADRAVPSLRDEIEEAAGHQQERAQIQRDLRVGQGAALDDPVVVSRVERADRRHGGRRLRADGSAAGAAIRRCGRGALRVRSPRVVA